MKIIEVPIYNDDGSVKITQLVSPEEAQTLLQFAINFMLAMGNTVQMTVGSSNEESVELND
jgi:hypothetical protein